MTRLLLLIALLLPALARAETVHLPGPDGVTLDAQLFLPAGKPTGPSIVALHGCGGPFPRRDNEWGMRLANLGHVVLMPDSFGSRGMGSQCSVRHRTVMPNGVRRQDALAAMKWLVTQPGTPPGGLLLLGWSDGGSTTLAAGRAAPDLPPGIIRGEIAFYPACRASAARADYKPAAPLLILIGEADDWTPAAPCHALAAKAPGITLVAYPGAYHEFDIANWPVKLRGSARGQVHVGGDPAARADALQRVPAFIAALP